MIEDKTNGAVLIATGAVGTSGKSGYLRGVTINSNGAAACTAAFYDGTGATGTLKYTITVSATAGDSRSSPPMNMYCVSGIYAVLTNTVLLSVEYSGCV